MQPSPTSRCRKRRREDKKKRKHIGASPNQILSSALFMEKWTEGGAAQSAASCVCFLNRNYESFAVRTRMISCLIYFLFFLCDYFLFFKYVLFLWIPNDVFIN